MLAFLTFVLALMMASTVSAEAEADPQFFYNPVQYYYPSYPQYHPYYYLPVVKSFNPVVVPNAAEKHEIRQIVPVFDYLRSGEVAYFRPNQAPKVQPVQGHQQPIISYTVPYTKAHLNRVPVSSFY